MSHYIKILEDATAVTEKKKNSSDDMKTKVFVFFYLLMMNEGVKETG